MIKFQEINMSNSYIKCLECGTVNVDNEYCNNCGNHVNIVLKRQIETQKKVQDKIILEEKSKKEPNKIEFFLQNGGQHSNSIIRFLFHIGYYIWIFLAFVVGGIISMIVAIAAG